MARICRLLTGFIFTLALPAAILSVVIAIAVNCAPLYHYGFVKYDTAATTGLEMAEMDRAAKELIEYWNSDEELISVTVTKNGQAMNLFKQRETLHLLDVKELIRLDYRVLTVSGGLILLITLAYVLRRRWRALAGALLWGSGLSLVLAVSVGVASVVDFNAFFTRFHLLSFSNDLWLLDPKTDYLIMLFPQGFWQDAFIMIAAAILALPLILGIGASVYLRRSA
jgi:integral membrane protein (TIGR01906 family)